MFPKFQNYKKIIFLLFVFGLLVFDSSFLYNKGGETLAQGQLVLVCGNEIPMGEVVDETLDLVNTILTNADQMLARAGQQVTAANQIYDDLDLPGACQAGNCTTDCDITSTEVCAAPGEPCPPGETCRVDCPFGVLGPLCRNCWEETTCQIEPCTGNACPPDLLAEAFAKVGQISSLYSQIAANRDAIYAAKARAPGVVAKLREARGLLSECATPSTGYTVEQQVQVLEALFTCREAKFLKILNESEETCIERSLFNLFCCHPRTP